VNAVGWSGGHTFGNLTGSDKAGFQIIGPNGALVLSFNIDYLTSTSPTATYPSGYRSLGPFGGDGGIVAGTLNPNPDPALNPDIAWDTSLSRNLNNTGYFALVGSTATQVIGKPATAGCDAASAAAGTCFNLLVDSPKTGNTTDSYSLVTPNPWTATLREPRVQRHAAQSQSGGPGRRNPQQLELPRHVLRHAQGPEAE
jgi:hypothetical protein